MKNLKTTKRCTSQLTIGAIVLCSALSACGHNQTERRQAPAQVKLSNGASSPPIAEVSVSEDVSTSTANTEQTRQNLKQTAGKSISTNAEAYMTSRAVAQPATMVMPPVQHGDRYADIKSNHVLSVRDQAVSTFSLDVDTSSYAVVRRHIQHGQLPPANAVRVEELINYFNYRYPVAKDEKHPFAFETELSTAAWNQNRQILRISLAAWKQPVDTLPASNLVFLVDVSGSMQAADKLPLLKSSLKLLARQMRAQDSVSLVTYAGSSAVVLEPTTGDNKKKILDAIDSLGAGGGTHGAAGLKDAYRLAAEHKLKDGINRVILATDGDFNVGMSNTDELVDFISKKREEGISLTTLGFGQGNYNDHLMEQLADKGDGNNAYIDTLSEAQKVLMEQVGATLYTVAKDAKVQVEFNPAVVAEYRLIGYENRLLREQDFNNDKIDAGDIGAGHTITALYEIALHGSGGERLATRRYSAPPDNTATHQGELAWVKLRYKARGQANSQLLEHKVNLDAQQIASVDMKFASAVAAWGDWLRQPQDSNYNSKEILTLAEAGRGEDKHGYRAEFIQLVKLSSMMR